MGSDFGANAAMEDAKDIPKVMGIFSTGRAGSTWLGSIVNTHPEVAYRFEPFHRFKKFRTMQQIRAMLREDRFGPQDVSLLYRTLLPAHPLVEKPPFFEKSNSPSLGRSKLWMAARGLPVLVPVFKWMYTPRGQPPVVFKDVTLEQHMKRFLERTEVKVVYLVRHPCGVVNSELNGQEMGVMSNKRFTVLASLLEKHDRALAARYVPMLDRLTAAEKIALLWRHDTEVGVRAAANHPNAMVVVYEELCDRPHEVAAKVFAHFGLEFPRQTAEFLEQLVSADGGAGRAREPGINSYFTVFRNPKSSMDKWKQSMATEDHQRVMAIAGESEVFQRCAAGGLWD